MTEKININDVLKAANNGDGREMITAGLCYANGTGVSKNIETSSYWLDKAMELGDVEDLSDLGDLYQTGDLVERDLDKAKHAFEILEDKYLIFGCYMLGRFYLLNTEVHDKELAIKYFKKASEMGHAISRIYYHRLFRDENIGFTKRLSAFFQSIAVSVYCVRSIYSKNSYVRLWRYSDIIKSKKFSQLVTRRWKTQGVL